MIDFWLHFGSLFGAETGVKSDQKTALKSEGTFRDFWVIPAPQKWILCGKYIIILKVCILAKSL